MNAFNPPGCRWLVKVTHNRTGAFSGEHLNRLHAGIGQWPGHPAQFGVSRILLTTPGRGGTVAKNRLPHKMKIKTLITHNPCGHTTRHTFNNDIPGPEWPAYVRGPLTEHLAIFLCPACFYAAAKEQNPYTGAVRESVGIYATRKTGGAQLLRAKRNMKHVIVFAWQTVKEIEFYTAAIAKPVRVGLRPAELIVVVACYKIVRPVR
jgi:hypothetical protein